MSNTPSLTISQMVLLYLFIVVPTFIFWKTKLPLVKKLLIGTVRMTIQLSLVGIYLKYIFKLNNGFINILWLLVMTTIAVQHIIKTSGFKVRKLMLPVFGGVFISLFTVLIPFILFIIKPTPFYDAQIVVPLGGMLLGNFLGSNIVALSNYMTSLKQNRQQIQTALFNGATHKEAVFPYLKEALRLGISPSLATMASVGLVSLPGMMTGQLLSGTFPVTAIKYQIAIMVAIVTASSISILLVLLFSTNSMFDKRDNIII